MKRRKYLSWAFGITFTSILITATGCGGGQSTDNDEDIGTVGNAPLTREEVASLMPLEEEQFIIFYEEFKKTNPDKVSPNPYNPRDFYEFIKRKIGN